MTSSLCIFPRPLGAKLTPAEAPDSSTLQGTAPLTVQQNRDEDGVRSLQTPREWRDVPEHGVPGDGIHTRRRVPGQPVPGATRSRGDAFRGRHVPRVARSGGDTFRGRHVPGAARSTGGTSRGRPLPQTAAPRGSRALLPGPPVNGGVPAAWVRV